MYNTLKYKKEIFQNGYHKNGNNLNVNDNNFIEPREIRN